MDRVTTILKNSVRRIIRRGENMQMMNDKIQLFEDQPIRTAWVEEEEEWYFSIVDVVGVLTEQPDIDGARNYWKVLKKD